MGFSELAPWLLSAAALAWAVWQHFLGQRATASMAVQAELRRLRLELYERILAKTDTNLNPAGEGAMLSLDEEIRISSELSALSRRLELYSSPEVGKSGKRVLALAMIVVAMPNDAPQPEDVAHAVDAFSNERRRFLRLARRELGFGKSPEDPVDSYHLTKLVQEGDAAGYPENG